jgi:hypothetical protein
MCIWYAASYTSVDHCGGVVIFTPFSCRLSAAAVSFSGHPVPAADLRRPHEQAYQQVVNSAGPQRGCHVPHWPDTTGVGCLLYPGTVVLT